MEQSPARRAASSLLPSSGELTTSRRKFSSSIELFTVRTLLPEGSFTIYYTFSSFTATVAATAAAECWDEKRTLEERPA